MAAAAVILRPSRVNSLGKIEIRIVEHIHDGESKSHSIEAYPFERILSIKQRISLLFDRKNVSYLPEYIFMAYPDTNNEGKFIPFEFTWNFTGGIDDPLAPSRVNTPDERLFDAAGNRLSDIYASEHSGILLEDMINMSEIKEIHIWSLAEISAAAGIHTDIEIPKEIMEGYFKLYFPRISKTAILQDFSRRLTDGENEDMDAAYVYHNELDKRLLKIDELIPELPTQPCKLRQLYRLRYLLPVLKSFRSSADLELAFYESKVTDDIPFIRYFPGNQRTAPLVKIAESATSKQPVIEQSTLSKMLRDIPEISADDETRHGILMYKIPVIARDSQKDIPAETMWTLTIFGHDGSAELMLQAPRKDNPLTYEAVQYAITFIPAILAAVQYSPDTQLKLTELNASYTINVSGIDGMDKKPSINELKRRIDLFQSFISPSRKLESQRNTFTLRYKAVSNFIKEKNPIFDHLTLTTFDKGKTELLKPEEYIAELKSHFGISQAYAASYISQWSALHSQLVEEGKSILDTANPGGFIGLYADHPVYEFTLLNIQSQRDMERILTLMSVFVSHTTDELVVSKSVEEMAEFASSNAQIDAASGPNDAVAAKAANEEAELAPPSMNELTGLGNLMTQLGTFGDLLGDTGMIEEAVQQIEEEAAAVKPATPAVAEIAAAPLGSASKIKYAKDEVSYLTQLHQRNTALFQYKLPPGKKNKAYVKFCQSAQGRQPNVMSLPQYRRARELYKETVTWVEGPLDDADAEAVAVASKSVSSRALPLKPGDPRRNERNIYECEKKALQLGFPLKGNDSIINTPSGRKLFNAEERGLIEELMKKQALKPLWIVYRLGTSTDEGTLTNYYMCAEYWCLYDNLPLLPTIVESTGKCPFCKGLVIKNTDKPELGETVLKRKENGLHKYIGFLDELRHPAGYAQPCCYKTPDNVLPPPDAIKTYPERQVELPPQQQTAKPAPPPESIVDEEEEKEEEKEEKEETAKLGLGDIYRNKPFTAKRDKVKKNEWFIPNQKIIGRTIEGWVDITPKFRGIVSVPPQTVNSLLQQDPELFLTAIRGVQAKSQNSYLAVPGKAFVRYGLGTDISKPGDNLFSLIAFAEYATHFLHDDNANETIKSNESVMDFMTSEQQIALSRMVSVFEQANYGTLLHEFSVPQVTLLDSQIPEFEAWWSKTSGRYTKPSDRTAAIQTYLAYQNFIRYIKDTSIKKDLRYFMSFFTTPKLLTLFGFIPIIINYYRKNTPATITCPEFGISFYHQDPVNRPPLLFIVHDVDSGLFDPLVLYEGIKTAEGDDEQRVVGLIHPSTPSFSRLSSDLRASLQVFIDKYFSPDGGCGRGSAYIHPWMPVRDTSRVPRLSEVLHVLDLKDPKKESRDKHVLTGGIRKEALLRDRSNRLIGVIVRFLNPSTRYIVLPCIDDGYISADLKNVRTDLYDPHGMLQLPTFDDILFVLTGKLTKVDQTRLVGHFKSYEPVKLIMRNMGSDDAPDYKYVALELACGILIPAIPIKKSESIRDSRFKEMEKKIAPVVNEMPWDLNSIVVGPIDPEAESVSYTSEEELDESYQLFRLAFSEWLRSSKHGDFVRDQIELLRRARSRLPLYELQKRLEILITAVVNPTNPDETWFTTKDGAVSRPMYRRNCLKLNKNECSSGCMWVPSDEGGEEGRCLIHTSATERYIDPVYTLIARLVDELLRTFSFAEEILQGTVPRLQSIQEGSIEHGDGSFVFSLSGRGDDDLYEQLGYIGRKPTKYTHGLVYPEETSLPGDFNEGDIPGDMPGSWSTVFRHLILGEDVARTPVLKFQIIFGVLAGMPIEKYESSVGHGITGTDVDWKELAELRNYNIIFTFVDPEIQLLTPYKIFGNTAVDNKYVVLDGNQVPFQSKLTGSILFSIHELPVQIRNWLSTQGIGKTGPVLLTAAESAIVAKAVPTAPTAAVPARKPRGKTTYPSGRTLTNGDCFFSSIYRAAKDRNKDLVSKMAKCLGITSASEAKFIQALRNKVADHIEAGNLPSTEIDGAVTNTYDSLIEQIGNDSYSESVSVFPDWFIKTFGKNGEHIGERKDFIKRLAEQVRISGNWVSEIEVHIVKSLLKPCDIELRITNSNKISAVGQLQKETADGKVLLNLWNQGEQHYVYFKDKDDE